MENYMYKETQRFNQWWIWAILIICIISSATPIYQSIIQNSQLSLDKWIGLGIISLVLIFFALIRLETIIKPEGIYIKFTPFLLSSKLIRKDQIESMEVCKYNSLTEFGGWGIRFSKKGTAYNVKGNQGLQIKLKNGELYLIGTQKPEELRRAIQNMNS